MQPTSHTNEPNREEFEHLDKKMIGIAQIDNAEWVAYDYYFKLVVNDQNGNECQCFITPRPVWCDRGHWMLQIDGHINLDDNDSFPRYFFSFKEADIHTRIFLKWRLWKNRYKADIFDDLVAHGKLIEFRRKEAQKDEPI